MGDRECILFVDDEPAILECLQRTLRSQRQRWDMHFVQSVDAAVGSVHANRFDAVVTDVTMPGRTGLDLLAELQGSDATRDIPVIVLTGRLEADLKRRALDLGAIDLLNKPIVAEDLVARLCSALRIKSFRDQLKGRNTLLEQEVRARPLALELSRLAVIWRLDLDQFIEVIQSIEQFWLCIVRLPHYERKGAVA